MPRILKPRYHNITLTDHAWIRFRERAGPYSRMSRKRLKRLLQTKLNNQLASGVYFNDTKAAELEIFPWLVAIIAIMPNGWQVLTIRHIKE